jgi:voltage-gated potassium channel
MFGADLRSLRVLRFARIFRIAKLARYSEALRSIGRVLEAKREELIVTFLAGAMLLVVSATVMYFAENAAQPEAFSSIPASIWWGVATLTTVGYGDVYPVTAVGRLIGSFVAVLGVGMFALPAGILGSGFLDELQKERAESPRCPGCGRVVNR